MSAFVGKADIPRNGSADTNFLVLVHGLAERRTEAEARLAELRRRRGEAALADKQFDNAEIDALTDAEGEQIRRLHHRKSAA